MKTYIFFIPLILILFSFSPAIGQDNYTVESIEKLNIKGFNIQFNPQGNKLLYTSSKNRGLKLFDIETGHIDEIIDEPGTGYQSAISSTDIYYQTPGLLNKFWQVNIITHEKKLMEASTAYQTPKAYIAFQKAGNMDDIIEVKASAYLNSIVLISKNGKSREIVPIAKADYLNISLSPDKKRLLFRVSGRGSYISDLNGSILHDLGNVEFPKWVNDKEVLFAEVTDNGHHYLTSDLYILDISGRAKLKLSKETNAIAIYPNISKDQKKVVFHTPEGEVYLIEISKN